MRRDMEAKFSWVTRWEMEKEIVSGSGAGGHATGILNASDSLIEAAAEIGQAADTIVFENVAKMESRLLTSMDHDAMWLINPTVKPQLQQLTVTSGTAGTPVFVPKGSAAESPYDHLSGFPIVKSEHCSALGDAGDIVLFSPSAYVYGVRVGATVDIDASARFEFDQCLFRLKFRADGGALMSTPVTPANGDTQSWAVSLETRS